MLVKGATEEYGQMSPQRTVNITKMNQSKTQQGIILCMVLANERWRYMLSLT